MTAPAAQLQPWLGSPTRALVLVVPAQGAYALSLLLEEMETT